MKRLTGLLACFVLAVSAASATSTDKRLESRLEPFIAHYAVYMDGKQRGESTIRLERARNGSWRYSVRAVGTSGMARLAGFEADDESEFRLDEDGNLRLQHMQSRSHALFKSREVRADFDWERRLANWSGDLKDDRRAPTVLTDRAVNGSLLNLALALDAGNLGDGDVIDYQMLDRGGSKQVEYVAHPLTEINVPAGRFQARPLRRERRDKDRVVTAWYSDSLPPTPVRVLQIDAGDPAFELRLLRVE